MSEATAAQQYFDPADPEPTCDLCEERQYCCDDGWCAGNEWDGERGWHVRCYENAINDLEIEVAGIPDGCADMVHIGELMTTLGVELVVKKEVVKK